jgi:hypothetical protein
MSESRLLGPSERTHCGHPGTSVVKIFDKKNRLEMLAIACLIAQALYALPPSPSTNGSRRRAK